MPTNSPSGEIPASRIMGCLQDKVVVITGAGRGIGRATALACARVGAQVVVDDLGCDAEGVGTDPTVATRVAAEIACLGAAALPLCDDVTDDDAPSRLVAATLARFGRIDAVFASAGIARPQLLSRLADDDLDRVLDVHLRAPIRLTREVCRIMQEQATGGSILLASGQSAFVGGRGQSQHAAANAGVTGFVRAAAIEGRRHGIRINALCALAQTRTTDQSRPFQERCDAAQSAEQVAQVALYLLSPLSAEVNGEVIGVTGTRVYSLRLHETSGAFAQDTAFSPETLAALWPTVTRG